MRWSAERRMEFIESRLYWEGHIGRKDLMDFFQISTPQATKDIKMYGEIAPGNMEYNNSAKCYVATEDFIPKVSKPTSERYLTRLRLLKGKGANSIFFSGTVPSFSEMPQLRRFVDEEILRGVLRFIRQNEAVSIEYQSMSSPEPIKRWITPHSLGFDGSRWHVRALCHNDKIYKDFNLGRIVSIVESALHHFDHSVDYEWHNEIAVTFAPNKELTAGKRAWIERDYGMKDGQVTLNMKAAFYYYFENKFGFIDGHEDHPGVQRQIVLINRDEIKAKNDLLKSMSAAKVHEMFESPLEF